MVNQTGHTDQIKQLNTGIVYRVIAQHGPISRIALSKKSQLAPASITKITRELMDAHLIKELEFPVLGLRGRPAVGLVTESEGWQFLAIRIEDRKIILSLKEINTKTLTESGYSFDVKDNDEFAERLYECISHFFEYNQSSLERVTAISILLDGIVDPKLGLIYRLPSLDIANLEIGKYLTQKTGLSVYLHPVSNALALTDFFFNLPSRKAKNIIYIQLQDVVNAAILSQGQPLEISSHRPILFGHTRVAPIEAAPCYCGETGCLETKISVPAIIKKANYLLIDYPLSTLNDNLISIDSICHGALIEDELCLSILRNVADQLAQSLALMINILGTELILINSPLTLAADIFFTDLSQSLKKQSSHLYFENLKIEKSTFTVKDSETSIIQQSLYDGSLLLQLLQG